MLKEKGKADKAQEPIKNKIPHTKICMVINKSWASNFANKHTDKHPKWNDKCNMCPRWFLQKYCFNNCKQKESHMKAGTSQQKI
jgi:hypothetical protein